MIIVNNKKNKYFNRRNVVLNLRLRVCTNTHECLPVKNVNFKTMLDDFFSGLMRLSYTTEKNNE